MEDAALAEQIAPLHLRVVDIAPDGNCLYSAIGDQCEAAALRLDAAAAAAGGGGGGAPLSKHSAEALRRAAAAEMRANPDEYAPFLERELDEYVEARVLAAGVWGGEVELKALARALRVAAIIVHRPHGAARRVDGAPCGTVELNVSYHEKAYALGAHYNSLRRATP